ncbi:C-type lectin domain family 14 member A isoform X2 [Betta splendens]|nr:C-type lectin domain family 14 member A isoform X2 [Betta splendens]
MASGLCSYWTYLWTVVLFRTISADSTYILSDDALAFDLALQKCAPRVLTTFATKQEIHEILNLISGSGSSQSSFTVWIGLNKQKTNCTDHRKPLRGFMWTETRSEDSEAAHWAEEPENTCTSVLCAAVRVDLDGSKVTRWGLISVRCKSTHRFICKLKDGLTAQTPKHKETSTGLATSEPKLATSGPKTPEMPNAEPGTPEPKLLTRLDPEVVKPTTGPKQVGRDHGLGFGLALGSCKHPTIPESRSITLGSDHNRIKVECWSSEQLELYCRARLAMWFLPDNSPANFSTICQRCRVGFQKDASANCVDVDECSSGHARCKHTCLNTEGSYRCICADGTGKQHQEDSPACTASVAAVGSGSLFKILILVLVAMSNSNVL